MAGNRRMKQEEQLMLPLCEMTNRREQGRDITFLPTFHLCRRVLTCRRQVRAVLRTIDLDEALRRAAHRANRLTEGRTRSASLALSAGRAGHTPASHSESGDDNEPRGSVVAFPPQLSSLRSVPTKTAMCRISDRVLKCRQDAELWRFCDRCARFPAAGVFEQPN